MNGNGGWKERDQFLKEMVCFPSLEMETGQSQVRNALICIPVQAVNCQPSILISLLCHEVDFCFSPFFAQELFATWLVCLCVWACKSMGTQPYPQSHFEHFFSLPFVPKNTTHYSSEFIEFTFYNLKIQHNWVFQPLLKILNYTITVHQF